MARPAARRFSWESGPFVAQLNVCQPSQQLRRPEPLPRQQLTRSRYTWGRVIRGIFSPPILLPGQQEGFRQQAHGDVMVPLRPRACPVLDTGCGSRTHPIPRRSSPSRTRLQCATGSRPHGPGFPRGCPRERWTGSSGVRRRPGSGGRLPRTSPRTRYPHSLGAVTVGARPLAAHPMVISRQTLLATPRRAGPWSAAPPAATWVCGDARCPDWAGWSRWVPTDTVRSGRTSSILHSRRRNSLPQRGRHPDSGIPSHPLRLEVATGPRLLQHLQRQLRLLR